MDPNDVEHKIVPRFYRNIGECGTYVISGDWDRRITDDPLYYHMDASAKYEKPHLFNFENYDLYQCLLEHFRDGNPWKQTAFYARVKKERCKGRRPSGRYSAERIDSTLKRLDELYDHILNGGYRTQRDMNRGRLILNPPELGEITVAIGRTGEIIECGGGQHRLMIAKILDLDSVPVRVFVRHSMWQKVRCEVEAASDYSELSDIASSKLEHPDMVPMTG
ncbi:hypothetical protein OB905_10880 [Halobacteria archaeon AArc-dxtr1]|nr:hypothetical protein [Halobacteria archaeon AArc-dxtr1]